MERGGASICESNWGQNHRSRRRWRRRPRRLNPHYIPFIIVFSFLWLFSFFFLWDTLMAAVACNYGAIICFLASNWCSSTVMPPTGTATFGVGMLWPYLTVALLGCCCFLCTLSPLFFPSQGGSLAAVKVPPQSVTSPTHRLWEVTAMDMSGPLCSAAAIITV